MTPEQMAALVARHRSREKCWSDRLLDLEKDATLATTTDVGLLVREVLLYRDHFPIRFLDPPPVHLQDLQQTLAQLDQLESLRAEAAAALDDVDWAEVPGRVVKMLEAYKRYEKSYPLPDELIRRWSRLSADDNVHEVQLRSFRFLFERIVYMDFLLGLHHFRCLVQRLIHDIKATGMGER